MNVIFQCKLKKFYLTCRLIKTLKHMYINIDNHPKHLLKEQWIKTIRENAKEAESKGTLTQEQLSLFYKEDWFKVLLPTSLGGAEWDLPKLIAFEEAVAWMDGSAGWIFTLCTGAGWLAGFMQEKSSSELDTTNDKWCMAGSGAVGGTAVVQPDGNYLVNGSWKYVTGIPHTTIFTANCVVTNSSSPKDKEPVIQSFYFLPHEVSLLPTWNQTGLTATASHSFEMKNLLIPHHRSFEITPSHATHSSPLYQYPFLQLAELSIAATLSGICLHFVEACQDVWKEKQYKNGTSLWEQAQIQSTIQKYLNILNEARKSIFSLTHESWNICSNGSTLNESLRTAISSSSQHLVTVCRNLVYECFPYVGLTGTSKDSTINQIWRDFQTGSMHALFSPLKQTAIDASL